MDEVIPSDHPRRVASRVIQWYGLIHENVILYARSSYYYDNMFIICLNLTFFLIIKPVLVFNPEKLRERCHNVTFLDDLLTSHQHVFRLWFHACNLLYVTSPQKRVTDVSLVLKDSDTCMDSENLSSLIRLSVSDGQKTDSSKVVSAIGI